MISDRTFVLTSWLQVPAVVVARLAVDAAALAVAAGEGMCCSTRVDGS
jgi:hypothetical protein